MFIGGLNWDTTDGRYSLCLLLGSHNYTQHYNYAFLVCSICFVDGLRDYFSQFGKVDACTIMRDAAGRSRCFAFLTFEDPASVNAVMVREHILDGKIVGALSPLSLFPLSLHSILFYFIYSRVYYYTRRLSQHAAPSAKCRVLA